jgi:hypothetical protein
MREYLLTWAIIWAKRKLKKADCDIFWSFW